MSADLERIVADALVARDVDTVFGIMGMGNLHLISQLIARDVHYVSARHENSAVSMADAWARVTGRVGVCTVTRGPGLTNTITSLVEAKKSGVPLVLFVGETASPAHPQNWAHRELIEGAGIEYFQLDGDALVASSGLALDFAMSRRGPIVVELRARDEESVLVPPTVPTPLAHPFDSPAVDAAVAMLRAASRPVILAGRGAVDDDAGQVLEHLAELSGALLASTAMANGMFGTHPRSVGVSGGFSSVEAVAELVQADLVVAFGASLNQWTLRHGLLYGDSVPFIQVDIDEGAFGRYRPVELRVRGGARAVAQSMALAFETSETSTEDLWTSVRPALEVSTDRSDVKDGLDPDLLCRTLVGRLPQKRTVAVDSGHFFGFAVRYLQPDNARSWVFSQSFLSLGLGLASGIGAAVARPGVLGIAVCGDGGTLMSLGEIDTAVREELPLLIVIMNDHGYGAEVHELRHLGLPESVAQFNDVDFAAVGRALGARGETIREYADLAVIDGWLDDPIGPLVLDCKVNPFAIADWLREMQEQPDHM